ncbi:hypothetical protein T4E_1082 [Trichinella pseudospiralis]|uniref:Uncharacterized protein n=1 Tax=Trichinella pseudospiralis TaxID=6337 RepID=A0A0V0YH31_TRIPS|nr:hypothetical protein T4E_1082 [Trichinella pseudospiralis]KRY88278.1 hypothetical protein T4D_14618 [Trichinella pseudospiralis]
MITRKLIIDVVVRYLLQEVSSTSGQAERLENGKRLIFDKQLKSNKSKLTPADRAHSAMTASVTLCQWSRPSFVSNLLDLASSRHIGHVCRLCGT